VLAEEEEVLEELKVNVILFSTIVHKIKIGTHSRGEPATQSKTPTMA
jgi:hypothetical protein